MCTLMPVISTFNHPIIVSLKCAYFIIQVLTEMMMTMSELLTLKRDLEKREFDVLAEFEKGGK